MLDELYEWLENEGITPDKLEEYHVAISLYKSADYSSSNSDILESYMGAYLSIDNFVEEYLADNGVDIELSKINIVVGAPMTMYCLDYDYIWNGFLSMGYYLDIQCQDEGSPFFLHYFIYNECG